MIEKLELELELYNTLLHDKERISGELAHYNHLIEWNQRLLNNPKTEQKSKINSIVKNLIREIAEIQEALDTVNLKLGGYDEERITLINDYLSFHYDYRKLCEEIHTAEKLSMKSDEEKVEIISAEGRKKLIDIDLADYYRELVKTKKAMAKRDLNYMNMINYGYEYKKLKSKKEQKQIETDNIIEKEHIEIDGVIETEEKTSIEQRIENIEKEIQYIINSCYLPKQGKKRRLKFDGKVYEMPLKYVGKFLFLNGQLKKFKREKLAANSAPIISEVESIVEEPKETVVGSANLTKKPEESVPAPIISEAESIVEEPKETVSAPKNMFADYTMNGSKLDAIERDGFYVPNSRNNTNVQPPEESVVKIVNIVKSRSKLNIINRIKKVALTAAVAAMIMLTVLSSKMTKKISLVAATPLINEPVQVQQSDIEITDETTIADSEIGNANDALEASIEQNSADVVQDGFEEQNPVDAPVNDRICLFDMVTVEKESPIYKDSYSAQNQTNALKPLYSHDLERQVLGICITMPNGQISVVRDDNQNVDLLLSQGGVITSYLTGDTDKKYPYEGFYQTDSVKKVMNVIELEGGKSI